MNYFYFAAPFQCPLAPFAEQLSPLAFGRVSSVDFFPEGLNLSSKAKAAAYFDASESTLEKWIAERLVNPIKRGRCYFFPLTELVRALEEPKILAFMEKKAIEKASGKKRKKPARKTRVSYMAIPIPEKEYMFVLIRYKGNKIAWYCSSSLLRDDESLKSLAMGVISQYFYCQSFNKSFSLKN